MRVHEPVFDRVEWWPGDCRWYTFVRISKKTSDKRLWRTQQLNTQNMHITGLKTNKRITGGTGSLDGMEPENYPSQWFGKHCSQIEHEGYLSSRTQLEGGKIALSTNRRTWPTPIFRWNTHYSRGWRPSHHERWLGSWHTTNPRSMSGPASVLQRGTQIRDGRSQTWTQGSLRPWITW